MKTKNIGEKMIRKNIILRLAGLSLIALFFAFSCFYFLIGEYVNLSDSIRFILTVAMTTVLVIVQLPVVAVNQRIEYDDEYIKLYENYGYANRFKEALDILTGKESKPSIKIAVKEVLAVKLSYQITQGGYGQRGYALVINLLMKNGTAIKLMPSVNYDRNKNGVYLEFLDIFEKNDIELIDKLNLRDGLIKDAYYFQEYVKRIRGDLS